MLKKILLVLLAVVLALAVIISLRPSTFRVERSISVAAPPSVCFELVNDFRHWNSWSPWAKLDPQMTEVHSGSASGEGAVYEWQGNSEVGKGRMTIVESHPYEHIQIHLEFLEPFAAVNTTDFRFDSRGEFTEVRWIMTGDMGFVQKAMGLVMDMETYVGDDFEKGLAQMSEVASASSAVTAPTDEQVDPQQVPREDQPVP